MSTISQIFIWQVYAQNTNITNPNYQQQYQWFFDSVQDNKPLCKKTPTSQPISCSQITIEDLTKENCWSALRHSTRWQYENTWQCGCSHGITEDGTECLNPPWSQLGINCTPQQLAIGTCTRNINKTLGIRQSNTVTTPTMLVADVVLAATGFVGTLLTVALLVMGGKYVMWWFDESTTGDLKNNIKKLLIWLLMVIGSYTVIKIIQFVARGF